MVRNLNEEKIKSQFLIGRLGTMHDELSFFAKKVSQFLIGRLKTVPGVGDKVFLK